MLGAAIWLPLALGGLEVALRGRPGKGIALAGLGLGLSALAGHAQISYYVWMAAGLWAAVSIAAAALRTRRSGGRAVAHVVARGAAVTAGAFLVAAGLASVQLLGTLEYSHLILRQKEAYATVVTNRVHAGFLATSLIPDYFGNPADHNFRYLAFAYTSDDRGGTIRHRGAPDYLDDGPEKPIRIWSRMGRRPLLAALAGACARR